LLQGGLHAFEQIFLALRLALEIGLETQVAISPRSLGGIERQIGAAQQGLGIATVLRIKCAAQTHRNRRLPTHAQIEGLAQRREDALRRRFGRSLAAAMAFRQQHGEFVPAHAGHDFTFAQDGCRRCAVSRNKASPAECP
jgi:hypothetical protein